MWKVHEIMTRFNFTKAEVEEIKSKIYLSEDEEKILDMRLLDYSITKMSIEMNMSVRTVNRYISKIKNKIKRAI